MHRTYTHPDVLTISVEQGWATRHRAEVIEHLAARERYAQAIGAVTVVAHLGRTGHKSPEAALDEIVDLVDELKTDLKGVAR
jgi:hypothetical protein